MSWIVSNCEGSSGRNAYAKELQKHVQVDIYGKCGPLTVGRVESEIKGVLSQYKFYLSFENTRCEEYMTEKLSKILYMPMEDNPPVPIILGPSREHCESMLPDNSYLHIDDFKGPKHLAKYLQFLDEHPDEYKKYLTWRTAFRLRQRENLGCKLCQFLWDDPKPSVIQNFQEFFQAEKCVPKPVPLDNSDNNSYLKVIKNTQ